MNSYEKNQELVFREIPILNNNKIEAYVLKDTILESIINNKGGFRLGDIKRPIIIVNEQTNIPKLFDRLLKKREHISLVVDKSKKVLVLLLLKISLKLFRI